MDASRGDVDVYDQGERDSGDQGFLARLTDIDDRRKQVAADVAYDLFSRVVDRFQRVRLRVASAYQYCGYHADHTSNERGNREDEEPDRVIPRSERE